jgi:hypothetical protein
VGKNKSPTAPLPFPEPPTAAARLMIRVGPAHMAEGIVPPDQARHLITTFGILGCVFSGVGGAVLTLRIEPILLPLAFAQLALALASAVLIALAGRVPLRRRRARSKTAAGQPRRPRQLGDDQPEDTARLRPVSRPSEPPRTSR